ncbi:cilia- and flagella-associated protein 54 [Pelobates fuscus]|uniref:cilia- and flagella-associated protein 54 n=1 Tax=Pelobates fuscus TaxID=191477 RepID=UPI002FE4B169
MEPLPATFYGDIDPKNPVIITFENEIKQLLGFLRKVHRSSPSENQHQDYRKGTNTLFHIWVKYKPRLPASYYQEKLLKVGDSLVQFKEYRLALYQCYGRYLEQFCSVNIDDITDINQFQTSFFPNGTDDKKAGLTFHALEGRCICIYQLVKTSDPNLQNEESLKKCLCILSFLQLIMQVVLPQENLCWLIFNGSLYIYTICRHLMVRGHSAKALEFLLWASVCMESSVPLLSVHYLRWRATLYTAVCQCYFDCQAGVHGEVFARRALSKINELSQLENMSNASFSQEAKNAFKEATLKMAVMIFKRAVFESRRKPKGILRPKQKSNLKDVEKLPWPRTNTEKLLIEMFDNSAAQFLAILEALSDSNRRVLQAGPPVPNEPEIYDVIDELFFAGMDILSGGGNKTERGSPGNHQFELSKLLQPSSLMDLAIEERDAVSAEAAVKFAKLAFSYEHWDVFDAIITQIYTFLQAQDASKWKKEGIDLKLLIAAEPLLSGKKHKHGIRICEKDLKIAEIAGSLGIVGLQGESLGDRHSDDHITLAETLFSCAYNSSQDVQADRDIVIDVILFLWQKCKVGVQRITAATSEGSKFMQRSELNSKWIYILCLLYEAMQHCNIIDADAVIMGEAALRLSGICESMADSTLKYGRKSDRSLEKRNVDTSSQAQISDKRISLKRDPVTQLVFANETLEKAIKGISLARSHGIMPDEASVIDHYCGTLGAKSPHLKNASEVQNSASKSLANSLMMMDLQLELIVTQHRVSVKLLNLLQGGSGYIRPLKSSLSKQGHSESSHFQTESEIIDKIKKNKLSLAIFFMQKAVQFNVGSGGVSPNKLLEDSEKLIEKAEAEESAVYLPGIKPSETLKNGNKNIPPAPILICRTENSMVFKPARFKSDVKVSWFCLYGRCVTGPNLKVRLNDYQLAGTGEQIPANSSNVLEVTGLQANERYIFAVAAFSSDGVLIGDSIGETSKPIVAFPPLPVPATWAHLAQSAYQVGNYHVAKKACSLLWNYFVLPPVHCPSSDIVASNHEDYVVQKRLCLDAISKSSPILLQLFLRSIFISCDINIKEGSLFCDSVCDNGVLRKWQMCRIAECERLLVALDVSSWHNDTSFALQAIVQCYGLIAPLIYHRISTVPVVQILIKCLVVLQEIPCSTWQKKQAGVNGGVLHMIACIVYYVVKVLRSWEEYELAISVIEIGKTLLDMSEYGTSFPPVPLSHIAGNDEIETTKESTEKEKGPKKGQKKKVLIGEKVNEQLAVLEQNLLNLTNPSDEIELTGEEDPLLLHSVVSCWPATKAYREVLKFRKKSRFLEFFVQLLQREVYEEKFARVVEWSGPVLDFLKRRNDQVFCKKKNEDPIDVMASTDSPKRYTAAVVEYHKDKEATTLNQSRKLDVTKEHKKSINTKQRKQRGQSQQRNVEEDKKKRAFVTLVKLLTPVVARYMQLKRLINTCREEMPWRSQMNLLLALTHFSIFRKKLDQHYNDELTCSKNSYRILDPEILSLHNAGTVVIATDDTVDEQISNPGHLHPLLKLDLSSGVKLTDLNYFSQPSTNRSGEDTPRTQLTNETDTPRTLKEEEKRDQSVLILRDHLGKTFIHMKRAVVLAHRGGHWTLLQNACRCLWNLTLELQLAMKKMNVPKVAFPINQELLNEETWRPFYSASDMLLNMLVILQNTGAIKVLDTEESFSVPSAMGGIADEEGGSNLTFENPFDDVSVVDLRCICQIVLKALEILYHVQKWEALIHIAIQFNLLTHERYTEQVTPLLVHAQRMVAARIHNSLGSEATALTLNTYVPEHKGKIHCRNYIGKHPDVANISNKDRTPRADKDEKRHIGNSDDGQVKELASVPIDVMDTFTCFRESLQKSKYPGRALRHSRKLLSLFIAHGQGFDAQEGQTIPRTSNGKVGFSQGTMQSHQPFPPDLSEEEFKSLYTIETKTIPPSHLSTVISSYDKTIEILHLDNQQGLKAQALHELGSLHLYAGNKRAAFKCWCQALDETLNMPDALNSWQELDSSPDGTSNGRSKDYSEKFLCRAGIWGCLLAAVITAKMSRYILTSSLRKRTECCMLSALLFKALFQVSLPHPKENRDFALYEIGEGCEISELIPGIDLFSDRYRADVNTVVACLSFLVYELHSAGQDLVVLPLLSLYQYFVSTICRDPVRSVEGRFIKVKVLTDLHLFAEACHEISILNYGKRIPRRSNIGSSLSGNLMNFSKFSSLNSILSRENLQAIEDVFNQSPGSALTYVYDNATMNKLELAKMYFILKLSSTINAIPEAEGRSSHKGKEEESINQENGSLVEETDVFVQLHSEKDLTLPKLKGILLNEAERRVNSILRDLQVKHQNLLVQCPAGELEMAVEARCYLAEVARQRHQTPLSVAMAYSAMRLLQDAEIFTMKNVDNVSPLLQQYSERNKKVVFPSLPRDTEARERLSMRTWLSCRLILGSILTGQLQGVAIQDQDMLDASTIITEGMVEAETLSDVETQAQLMLQAATLDLQEGHPKKGVQLLLENIIHLLEGKHFICPVACFILAQSYILLADLMEIGQEENPQVFWTKQLNTYTLAHKLIIKQCVVLGEVVENHETDPVLISPLLPFRNIYLPHINLLAKVKLRIGHLLTLKACSVPGSLLDASDLLLSHNLQTKALELCQMSSFREWDLETDLLFQKGRIERQMYLLGDFEKFSAIKTFSDAICVSRNYDQNLGLIKKSYLEIALLYLHKANLDTNMTNDTNSSTVKALKETVSKRKVETAKEKGNSGKPVNPSEFYRLLAWIAIRAATQVGDAMLACKQFIGQDLGNLPTNAHEHLSSFAYMELLTSYKNYLPDDGQMNIWSQDSFTAEGEGAAVDNMYKGTLSWVHLVRYHSHLMRLISMTSPSGFARPVDSRCCTGDSLYTSVFNNGVIVCFAEMHTFLKKYLNAYDKCCVDDFPQELLKGLETPLTGFNMSITTSNKESHQTPPSPGQEPIDGSKNEAADEKMAIASLGTELCIQWYFPTLERLDHRRSMVLLLYAYNKHSVSINDPKMCDPSNLLCGHIWIPLSRALSLHEKLSDLKQQAELSLNPVVDPHFEKQKHSSQTAKSKKDLEITQVPIELQELTKQCCSEVQMLLSSSQDSKPCVQAPFDITLPSLIRLKKIFDLTHGCMLMKGSLLNWIVSLFT